MSVCVYIAVNDLHHHTLRYMASGNPNDANAPPPRVFAVKIKRANSPPPPSRSSIYVYYLLLNDPFQLPACDSIKKGFARELCSIYTQYHHIRNVRYFLDYRFYVLRSWIVVLSS